MDVHSVHVALRQGRSAAPILAVSSKSSHGLAGPGAPGFRPAKRLLVGIALWLCLSGCVERRMTVRTNVDNHGGALVYIDNREVGYTPVSTGFTYYADREIRLIKDGYETVTLVQPIPAPWWDSLPLEFFVENLWPFAVRDDREFHYELAPAAKVTTGEVIQRAQQLRNEGQFGAEAAPGARPVAPSTKLNF